MDLEWPADPDDRPERAEANRSIGPFIELQSISASVTSRISTRPAIETAAHLIPVRSRELRGTYSPVSAGGGSLEKKYQASPKVPLTKDVSSRGPAVRPRF